MLFAVGVPTGLLAGAVQRGIMGLILSRCVSKTHVYLVDSSQFWKGRPLENMAWLTAILLVAAVAGGIIWRRRDLPL